VHLWSPKVNGWRALVHTPTGTMFNRQGQLLSIAGEFTQALALLRDCGIEWLDCEAFERRHNLGRGSLVLLDAVIPALTASERWHKVILASNLRWPMLTSQGPAPGENQVYLIQQTDCSDASPSSLRFLSSVWDGMQLTNKAWGVDFYEGLVAKRADSPYPIQLRSATAECPFWVKHRWAW
jgi:hypothetical protein